MKAESCPENMNYGDYNRNTSAVILANQWIDN